MPSSQNSESCCPACGVTLAGRDVLQRANAQCAGKRKTIGKKDLFLRLTSAMVTELARNDLLETCHLNGSNHCYFMGYEIQIDDTVIDWQFGLKEQSK